MAPTKSGYPVIIKNGNRPKKNYVSEKDFYRNTRFNSCNREMKKPILGYCYPKKSRSTMDALQMILYSNSICVIGVDAWRNLDKHDCSSYPLMKMSLEEALNKFDIISEKGGKLWTI